MSLFFDRVKLKTNTAEKKIVCAMVGGKKGNQNKGISGKEGGGKYLDRRITTARNLGRYYLGNPTKISRLSRNLARILSKSRAIALDLLL